MDCARDALMFRCDPATTEFTLLVTPLETAQEMVRSAWCVCVDVEQATSMHCGSFFPIA